MDTECPICLIEYKYVNPILICKNGHTICESCLNSLKKDNSNTICPICRSKIIKSPKLNLLIRKFNGPLKHTHHINFIQKSGHTALVDTLMTKPFLVFINSVIDNFDNIDINAVDMNNKVLLNYIVNFTDIKKRNWSIMILIEKFSDTIDLRVDAYTRKNDKTDLITLIIKTLDEPIVFDIIKTVWHNKSFQLFNKNGSIQPPLCTLFHTHKKIIKLLMAEITQDPKINKPLIMELIETKGCGRSLVKYIRKLIC